MQCPGQPIKKLKIFYSYTKTEIFKKDFIYYCFCLTKNIGLPLFFHIVE